jgi:hypothetical protein
MCSKGEQTSYRIFVCLFFLYFDTFRVQHSDLKQSKKIAKLWTPWWVPDNKMMESHMFQILQPTNLEIFFGLATIGNLFNFSELTFPEKSVEQSANESESVVKKRAQKKKGKEKGCKEGELRF